MQIRNSNGETFRDPKQACAPLMDPLKLDSIRTLDPDGKIGLLKRVVDLYIEKSPPLIQQMLLGLDRGNSEEVYRAAHSLKSSSATVGATGLAEMCRRLEMAGREGSLEGAPEMIREIDAEFSRVCAALTRQIEGH
jgi:HPt (histidine-containing phosphotransfer) domain-containing protein